MRMCTDERAASTSAKIRGKKFRPSTHGSIVAAVDQAKSSAASCGRDAVARGEGLRRGLRACGRHRVGRRRPALPLRDPEHLPVDEDEQGRRQQPHDSEGVAAARWPPITDVPELEPARDAAAGRCEGETRADDENEPVAHARAEDVPAVPPARERRPADHGGAAEHPDDPDPAAPGQRAGPEERRHSEDHHEPAVVRALSPVETHWPVVRPGAEHADDRDCDRDRHDDLGRFQERPLTTCRGRLRVDAPRARRTATPRRSGRTRSTSQSRTCRRRR